MWIDYLIMSYKEMMEEYNRLLEKWKKLPVGSEERLELEIELVDISVASQNRAFRARNASSA